LQCCVCSQPIPRLSPRVKRQTLDRSHSIVLIELDRQRKLPLALAVGEALTDAGFIVDRAGDGQEALRRVNAVSYDLIVCDLKMPKVDGIRFYQTLVATHPDVARRVIFVTGDVAGTEAERFLQESGCRWLAKPFRLADLLRAVADVLA